MFTGIVKAKAKILNSEKTDSGLILKIEKPKDIDINEGTSLSVNGACLTAMNFDSESFSVTLMKETLNKTIFGKNIPEEVNIEPSVSAGDPMDGHFVQGHVDTVGKVEKIEENQYTISFSEEYKNLVVEKGGITINGVSLTIFNITNNTFDFSLIPYTLENTTLSSLKTGDAVNIEFDIVGKYLARFKETNE